jgi:hypothetical protein
MIERSLDVAVQRPHNADARKHRWPVTFCNQQQRPHRCLPFFGVVFCLGQFRDVERGVAERGQRFALARHVSKIEIPVTKEQLIVVAAPTSSYSTSEVTGLNTWQRVLSP